MSFSLTGLRVVAADAVDMSFVDGDGTEVTYRFTASYGAGLMVVSGEREFNARYRQVPGPALPMWPEKLAATAIAAQLEPLPTGADLDALTAEVRRELSERHRRDKG